MADPNVDIADLEAAFAKEPASAFQPLTEAYLSQGRFMEAMVVCKKGIKAEPDNADGRLLLARVYAEQGKVPKAITEVQKLLDLDGEHANAHFTLGTLHERAGRFDEAIESWKKAFELDPQHAEAVEALQAKGVEVELGPSPEEIAAEEARIAAEEEAKRKAEEEAAAAKKAAEEEAAAKAAAAENPASPPPGEMPTTPPTGELAQPSSNKPPPRPRPNKPAAAGQQQFQSAFMGGYDPVAQQKNQSKKFGLGFTFALFAVLLVVAAVLIFVLYGAKQRADQVAKFTTAAEKSLKRDTTKDLINAVASLEQALEVDDEHANSAARVAYIYEVLVYERGLKERDLIERIEKGDIKVTFKNSLERAEDVAEDNPYTIVAKAISHIRRDEAGTAVKILKEKEGNAFIDVWLARAYLANGETKPALAIVEKHGKNVTNAGQLAAVGMVYRAAGQRVNAGLALNTAIKTSDDHDVARAQRAMLSLEVSDMTMSYGDVKYLADMGKDAIGTKQYGLMALGRAELARLNDRSNDAASDFKTAFDLIPKDPDALVIKARGEKAANKRTDAVGSLEQAVKQDKTRVGSWAALIQYAAEAKKLTDAEKAFQDAQKIWPDHPELTVARGYIHLRKRKFDAGIAELRAASKKLEDKESNILTMIGILELVKGDAAASVKSLTQAATMLKGTTGKERAWTYTTLGRALQRTDAEGEAKGAFAEAIKSNGTYPDAYYYFGQLLEKQGSSEAKLMYRNAIKFGLDGRKKNIAEEKAR
jgi:tetratricopeptide (TPR) repeat protein